MRRIKTALSTLGIVGAFLAPNVRGQSCPGNSEIVGAYALLGSRSIFASVPVTPPGTSGTTSTGTGSTTPSTQSGTPNVSATPIGSLVGGLTGLSPFAVIGRVTADGNGNLFASATVNGSPVQIGTYTVNADCTTSFVVNDVFLGMGITPAGTSGATGVSSGNSTGGTGTGSSTGTGNGMSTGASGSTGSGSGLSINLEGLVFSQGARVALMLTGATDTSATVTLQRLLQFGACTDATLNGVFGLVSQVTSTALPSSGTAGNTANGNTSSQSVATSSFIGRLVADGAGTFGSDALSSQSSLTTLQLTGSYTVNPDCSGTATVTNTTGATYNADFLIVPSLNSTTGMSVQRTEPELLFTLTGTTQSASSTSTGITGSGSNGTGTGSTTPPTSSAISGFGIAQHE